MKRRTMILGGMAAAAGWLALGRTDRGSNHGAYFQQISSALDEAGLARPTLVIDRDRLLANINALTAQLAGRYDYRIVAKSLPSLPLLEAVMNSSGSRRLMVFHQPFLNLLARERPDADLLLGKPMPVAAAERFYQEHRRSEFNPSVQLQWLLDSAARLEQYRQLAESRGTLMRINLELDVGMHRGGISSKGELERALDIIEASDQLELSGFMGYEPHVAKMPGILGGPERAFKQAQATYRSLLEHAEARLGRSLRHLTLNGAGSPTYRMYDGQQVANELAAGSALVKPMDFDIPTLQPHAPAAFIATPVIKSLPSVKVPGIEALAGLSAWADPNQEQAFFIYGGYWKASPVSPAGLANHAIYGRSTNQELLTGSRSIDLHSDDWVFLRPHQSEHVFLQFGDIAVYDQGRISELWPVFSQGA